MAADPRFFATTGPLSLAAIVVAAEGRSEGDSALRFAGVAALQDATSEEVSFLDDRRYLPALQASRAGAVLLQPAFASFVGVWVLWRVLLPRVRPRPSTRP